METYFWQAGSRSAIEQSKVIFRQDDPVNWMYWIVSGQTRLVRRSAEGQEIVLQSIASGLLAEASLFSQTYHCDAEVLKSGEAFRIRRKKFQEDLRQDSDLGLSFSA